MRCPLAGGSRPRRRMLTRVTLMVAAAQVQAQVFKFVAFSTHSKLLHPPKCALLWFDATFAVTY
jgi:hypothetical protein